MNASDTIAAIATARGRAALAIVRLSGPDALAIADRCFPATSLADADSHAAHVGYFATPEGERIDQVVVTLFRAPRSATGEDVVEVSCHGGDVAPQRVLRALLDAGARLARPGEFTERGFLHGKLDLAQAEAVADLIHARSSLAHRVSLGQLRGRYSEALDAIRQEILQACALVELELDFAEEDVEFADREHLQSLLERTEEMIDELLGSVRLGTLVRDGVRVVIGGRPNAGKSTLLNALVGHDRAIVSPTPGTTRDEIEAEVEIGGLTFRFIDTAGLRETDDAIEAEGVRRARASIEHADALIYLVDATRGLDPDESSWLQRFSPADDSASRFTVKQSDPNRATAMRADPALGGARGVSGDGAHTPPDTSPLPVMLVYNKQDLTDDEHGDGKGTLPTLPLSATRATRDSALLDPLRGWLLRVTADGLSTTDASSIVTNQRHRQHLARAAEAVRRAAESLRVGGGGDTLSLDLRAALHELGSITGAITNEDVLGTIFSQFCIGK